jgi:beta-galactosidase
MDRREFLKSSASAAAVASLPPAAPKPVSDTGRTVLPINRRWRFTPHAKPEFHRPGFNDAGFERVVLPHSNAKLPWHGFTEKDYTFLSTYRRTFRLPSSAKGRRVFVDFQGAMIASTVFCNGVKIGTYKGGYTPFSFELTPHLSASGLNVLSVELDSTERKDIPPFGNEVDYLTFGGIYREVALRIVPQTHIENLHARTKDVLTDSPAVEVELYLDRAPQHNPGTLTARVQLLDGDTVLAETTGPVATPPPTQHHPADADQAMGAHAYDPARDGPAATLSLSSFSTKPELWTLRKPRLYHVNVTLLEDGKPIDSDTRRIGFREATFTPAGFQLNGEIVKLHGLDRHQMFPWVGQAMAARGQRLDARVLRHDMNCNMVRTSHYPQSPHFLDACDEMGLLVLEELPGWQHIGDLAWQDLSVDNVRRMVRRDWNHPSIVLWGVRINESPDNHDFYTRTNAMSHALDNTRQTCGIHTTGNYDAEFLEDVFTYNDFGWPMKKPNHPRFLNTECVGHTFPTKTIDAYERQAEHFHRHARYHDVMASDPQYAGGLGWCAFDYCTHDNFGSGDRICYHGVMDIFRTPKPAAMFYKSMVSPSEQIVMEPAFFWASNDMSIGFSTAVLASNVETIRLTTTNATGEHVIGESGPNREEYPHLPWPPFQFPVKHVGAENWGDLRIDGMIGGKVVISKTYSGSGVCAGFTMTPDDTTLHADGADAVRVVLRVNDALGNQVHYASDGIRFDLTGPADLIGDNPFGLIGGTGAIWIRARETPGTVTLRGTHPYLGTSTVTIHIDPAPPELA